MPIYDHITPEQATLIRESPLFFIASAHPAFEPGPAGEGPVNLSPKGGVPLHVLDAHHVAYLDYPGSGNETARHARDGGPVTVMVMSITADDAAIVRLYGRAAITALEDAPPGSPILASPAEHLKNARQVITVTVEATQTSCGYGVPVLQYIRQRSKAGRGRRYKA
jgi:hypothetical protein